jgi:hypothetical protein
MPATRRRVDRDDVEPPREANADGVIEQADDFGEIVETKSSPSSSLLLDTPSKTLMDSMGRFFTGDTVDC